MEHGSKKVVNIESKDINGNTPLHLAAKYDRSKIADILLEHGADFYTKNNDGLTPSHLGKQNSSFETVSSMKKKYNECRWKNWSKTGIMNGPNIRK